MKKWYFPYGYDIEKESVNNARIETFKDNVLESLARETCQNSIDAAINDEEPVLMIFEEKLIDIENNIDRESFLEEIIPKARQTWKEDKKSQEFLKEYEAILKKKKIRVLRIGDYNTTGLEEANWKSLIENAGMSVKDDISSAGSFGIGKAAPFASSDLRMVFYNTRTLGKEEKSIGVTKFISFDNEDGTIAQGVGYLGSINKEPIKGQYSFGFNNRNKAGTDLFIIGFNQSKGWEDRIVKSLLENFLVTIYNNQLYIKVGNIVISKDTMKDIINKYEGREYNELKNYYSVLEELEKGNAKKINLDDTFDEFGFKPEDGELIISKGENANRSILMTRKAGMKIMDRKRISGSIQFNGIFQAKGDKFNEILKEMENPNHDDWIAERYKKDPRKAKRLLKVMYDFMKKNVIENFQEKIEEQVDAFGVNDFLPNLLKDNPKKNSELEKEALEEKITEIQIKEKKIKDDTQDIATGEDIERALEMAGIIEGDLGGFGIPVPQGTDITESEIEPDMGVGTEEGEYDIGDSEVEVLVEKDKKFEKVDITNYKIFDVDYINGEYILNLKPIKNIDKLKVEINYIGENGSVIKINLMDAKVKDEKLTIRSNYFIIEKLLGNERYIINFKIPYEHRIKMGVKFYEYK